MIIITNSISLIAYLPNPKTNADLDPNPNPKPGGRDNFPRGEIVQVPKFS